MVGVMNNYDPKTYWEKRGEDYKVSVDTSDELRNLARLILLHGDLDPFKGDLFLEVGSAYGRIFKYLESQKLIRSHRYLMCDIAESMITKCSQETGIIPDLWNGVRLPYPDDKFEWVISFSVLLHVPSVELEGHFKECLRVCYKYFYIATYTGVSENLASHNFAHDYQKLFSKFDIEIVNEKTFKDGIRTNWLLMKK